jgi:anti-sigma factor RsiW
MNCNRAQEWISAQRDGALDPARTEPLKAHLAACGACRAFALSLDTAARLLRERPAPAGPTPEAAWADVQRALRQQPSTAPVFAPMWEWLGNRPWRLAGTAAACGVIAFTAVWRLATPAVPVPVPTPAAPHTTEVLHVATGLADASTMVYEDEETGWTVIWVMPAEGDDHAHS